MGPMRELASRRREGLRGLRVEDVPPIAMGHFLEALETVRPTVAQSDLQKYVDWNSSYGSFRRMD
jgi:SpoVK/Ycf46/Vps4 family AAA+-type ATPase